MRQKPPRPRPLVNGSYDPRDEVPVSGSTMYCAPFCGRGCTRAEYEDALARGRAAADELGAGWESAPSENLGWHAKAQKGSLCVYCPGRLGGGFMAGTDGHGILGRGDTATGAVADMLENLCAAVEEKHARLEAVLAEVEE